MTENERVTLVRTETGKTMEKFGEALGVTKNAISNIESGRRGVTRQMREAICRTFDINKEWLRTGCGDMHPPKSLGEEIGMIAVASSKNNPKEAAEFFQKLLGDMTEAEILIMYEIMKRHFPDIKKKD